MILCPFCGTVPDKARDSAFADFSCRCGGTLLRGPSSNRITPGVQIWVDPFPEEDGRIDWIRVVVRPSGSISAHRDSVSGRIPPGEIEQALLEMVCLRVLAS